MVLSSPFAGSPPGLFSGQPGSVSNLAATLPANPVGGALRPGTGFGDPLFGFIPTASSFFTNQLLGYANGSGVNINFGPTPSTAGFGPMLLGRSFFAASGTPSGPLFEPGGPFANGALGGLFAEGGNPAPISDDAAMGGPPLTLYPDGIPRQPDPRNLPFSSATGNSYFPNVITGVPLSAIPQPGLAAMPPGGSLGGGWEMLGPTGAVPPLNHYLQSMGGPPGREGFGSTLPGLGIPAGPEAMIPRPPASGKPSLVQRLLPMLLSTLLASERSGEKSKTARPKRSRGREKMFKPVPKAKRKNV